ncbi:TMV resistance protein N-like [Senna tora]|uniref:TMV resistance protein N-like n=1 Tax=Senna tora TaxID=362788 RepID=A0A834TK11_9FABA|nr:TMV resistance protein N-like [Senna tora]
MMDSSKVLMLISTIALYKALRFISATLHASSPVATPSSSNAIVPISTVDSSSDIVHFPKLKIINVSYSEHLISLPDLSQAPNIETVLAKGCENLVQIHSSTVLPKLEDVYSTFCKRLRCVSIGSKMNGSVGLVAVYKGFDLLNLSFNKVTIKVFISDDHEGICGSQVKGVSVPFTNIENGGEIKLLGQSLRSLLPFVMIVPWVDMSESENFKRRFGTYEFSRVEESNKFIEVYALRKTGMSREWLELRGVECGGRNRNSSNKKFMRREVECCSNSIISSECVKVRLRLTRSLPNTINRWSLLTDLTLQKRDNMSGLPSLKLLAEPKYFSSTLQPIINPTISLDAIGRSTRPLYIHHDLNYMSLDFSLDSRAIYFRFWIPIR